MTRRFLALVVTAVLAVGAASAQSQSFGPYPASEVKAFLEKHPQFRSAFSAEVKSSMHCTDAAAAKAYEASRKVKQDGPMIMEAVTEGSDMKSATPDPVVRENVRMKFDDKAMRARLVAIDEELKANPANAKALISERESLLQQLKQRAPDAR